jgi:Rieske 2Fe-2S family protein
MSVTAAGAAREVSGRLAALHFDLCPPPPTITRDEMNVRNHMLDRLRTRQQGHTLTREFYTDPDWHRLDLEHLFYREWLFAGHDCELAKPGTYLTLQIGEYPVVVVRGDDGRIRAFHNTCRHRGSRICVYEHGHAAKLTCPYHRWTYDLDGTLYYARDMGEGFEASRHGLKPVHCESVAGYIWICVASDAPDLGPFRAQVEPYLAPHRLTETKVAFESTIIENGNWKLVWENNRECYHCRGSHPELCRTFPDAPTVAGIEESAEDPMLRAHWDKCEAAGLPSVFRIDERGQFRSTRMPLLRNAVSYTLSGNAAVLRRLSDGMTAEGIGALMLFHFPSTWDHVLSDHAVSFRVLPLGRRRPSSPPSGSCIRTRLKARTIRSTSSRASGWRPTTRTAASSRKISAA